MKLAYMQVHAVIFEVETKKQKQHNWKNECECFCFDMNHKKIIFSLVHVYIRFKVSYLYFYQFTTSQ